MKRFKRFNSFYHNYKNKPYDDISRKHIISAYEIVEAHKEAIEKLHRDIPKVEKELAEWKAE